MSRDFDRLARVPRSGIRDIFDRALRVPDAIHLEIGAPDFDTPEHIVEAAAKAARDGFTRYTATAGLASLRDLLAEKVRTRNAMPCAPENVVCAAGGCSAIHATLAVLIGPGEGVLIPDPAWPVYAMSVEALGGEIQRYPLLRDEGFEPDLDAIEALVKPTTRVLITNSPGNPTGGVHRRETVEALVELAERHDLWLISDEAYEDFVFEGEHVTAAALDGASDRVIGAYTFSKSYAMTGWRLGYVVAPGPVAAAVTLALEPLIACASSISQKAGEAAIAGPQDHIEVFRDAFKRRRDMAVALLDREGVPYIRPEGAFYLVVDVPGEGADSTVFAYRLLDDGHVAVAPGAAFGPLGEGMQRVSICASDEDLETGLLRLARARDEVPA